MDIKHDILSFDPFSGGLVVKYYTDEFQEGFVYSIDLPVQDNKFPEADELETLIQQYAPKGQLERIVQIKNSTVPASLTAYIDGRIPQDDSQVKAERIRSERNVLLLRTDYTQLPDAPLSSIEKEAWAGYRQALRNITTQDTFPDSVVFPLPPDVEPR